ncbi:hypothetical protein BI084_gp43 [Gordonia phage Terapin]|uniref:DUF2786 domain-containing protein n=5 Tax=Terapinvirus terapin TaxID=2734283 RepID=A0A345MB82_9CAUD|nr:hypothetical protein BI084_gp43 [Gordonia phage Terapin]AVP43319.1 hypothetical protein PBI_DJOKOVIC_42 [Gordonia phage Djokovic]AXH67753.1 hypothetical protein SEA_BEYONCAGE_42 [Gordonia phage Beyoncage]QOC56187.1 hypothetical protein SEA_SIENNA_42 [Gordonia phage Sienna]QOC56612.1 hypothetical protein SEA_BITESIZE_42 [Gordonia phage BiteSize]AOE44855.1 hypothetical protein SEA_TERAPIN_43 [Gordonia phage Terapin]
MSEDRRLRIIENLLIKASHEGTPEHERILSQEQADRLMAQYQIDRAILNFNRDEKEVRQPVERDYETVDIVQDGSVRGSTYNWNTGRLTMSRDTEEYAIQGVISGIRGNVFRHAGCMWFFANNKTRAIGYEEDLMFAEMLWLGIFSDIMTKMFPTWDASRGFDENVYRLKKAGYSWSQVREIGLKNQAKDAYGMLTEKNAGSKLRNGFKRHATKIGEEVLPGKRQPSNPHLWRRSFIDSYSATLSQRMAALKAGREEYFDKTNLPAMTQDKDRVRQRMYELYPELDPANQPKPDPDQEAAPRKPIKAVKQKIRHADPDAWAAGHSAASKINLRNDKAAGDRKEALA